MADVTTLPAGTVEERAPPRADQQKRIYTLAQTLASHRLTARKLEAQARQAADAARKIEERELPAALYDAGVSSLDLGKGWSVAIERFAHGSVSEANEEFAWDWLEADGEGDLVKHTVTVSFGRDAFKAFTKFVKDLAKRRRPVEYVVSRTVHAATLKKFIKERVAAENAGEIAPERRLPRDTFGVHEGTRAVLIGPEDKTKETK